MPLNIQTLVPFHRITFFNFPKENKYYIQALFYSNVLLNSVNPHKNKTMFCVDIYFIYLESNEI